MMDRKMDGFSHGWNRDFFLAAIFVYNKEKNRGVAWGGRYFFP